MKNRLKNKKIFFLVTFLILLLVLVWFVLGRGDVEKRFVYEYGSSWENVIRDLGPSESYEFFVEYNDRQDFLEQHNIAHGFGEDLFAVEGVDGATVCDERYGFGCYHQFFLSAVSAKGIEVVDTLDKVCIEENGFGGQGCQHGIGHGLVQYFGHSRINEALDVCGSLAWQEPLFGCQSGVFMEYNFPSIVEGVTEEGAGNKYDEKNPYHPCDTVAERFKYACFYSLPEWWSRGEELSYETIGDLCQGILNREYSKICFKGIGLDAVQLSEFEPSGAIEKCNQMPSVEGIAFCRAGVAWAFWDSDFQGQHRNLCSGLDEESQRICENESDLLEAI